MIDLIDMPTNPLRSGTCEAQSVQRQLQAFDFLLHKANNVLDRTVQPSFVAIDRQSHLTVQVMSYASADASRIAYIAIDFRRDWRCQQS